VDVELLETTVEASAIEGTSVQVTPGRIVEAHELFDKIISVDRVPGTSLSDSMTISQELFTEASLVGCRPYESDTSGSRSVTPLSPSEITNHHEGFPHVRGAINHTIGHLRNLKAHGLEVRSAPYFEPLAEPLSFSACVSDPERLNVLARSASLHPNHDRARDHRFWQIADAGNRNRAERWELLDVHRLRIVANTTMRDRAPAMACVDEGLKVGMLNRVPGRQIGVGLVE
jgi:hypothetical protein